MSLVTCTFSQESKSVKRGKGCTPLQKRSKDQWGDLRVTQPHLKTSSSSETSYITFLRTRSSWLGTVGTDLLRINSVWPAWWPLVVKWPDFSRGEQYRVVQGRLHTGVSTGTCLLNNSIWSWRRWLSALRLCLHTPAWIYEGEILPDQPDSHLQGKDRLGGCGESSGVFFQTLKKRVFTYYIILQVITWYQIKIVLHLFPSVKRKFCSHYCTKQLHGENHIFLCPCFPTQWFTTYSTSYTYFPLQHFFQAVSGAALSSQGMSRLVLWRRSLHTSPGWGAINTQRVHLSIVFTLETS